MSERNGDRARFQKNRKRKLNQRERTRDLIAARGVAAAAKPAGDGPTGDAAATAANAQDTGAGGSPE